jgi:Zn-dependent M28 family amino/carboxypeptidase
MRMLWFGLLVGLLLAAAPVIGLGAWYMLWVPGRSHEGPLPAATAEELGLADKLRAHVTAIASTPHNVRHPEALEEAARYIERVLNDLGYAIDLQRFAVGGVTVRNIEATREARAGLSASTLVVGAHYDSYGEAPGANDNATGTAAVLELARMLKDWQPQATRIRFALFVNEEPPYYRTPDMGSWRYAKRLSERGERVRGMISLETLGAFSDAPGSQRYPPPFGLVFPSTANFVALVGLPGGRGFLHEVIGSFRKHLAFPSIGGVAPDAVPGIGWSDHWAFHQFGFPAIMATDTALFRYPHYHLPSDTPDKVDYERLARITKGFALIVRELAP